MHFGPQKWWDFTLVYPSKLFENLPRGYPSVLEEETRRKELKKWARTHFEWLKLSAQSWEFLEWLESDFGVIKRFVKWKGAGHKLVFIGNGLGLSWLALIISSWGLN